MTKTGKHTHIWKANEFEEEEEKKRIVYNFDCSLKSVANFCATITLPLNFSLPLAKS